VKPSTRGRGHKLAAAETDVVHFEIAERRARLLAALRALAAARERCEGGAQAATGRLDLLREDITAALELLENRPERTMSARPLRTQRRIRVAPERDQL
jgi:hypothetical protein